MLQQIGPHRLRDGGHVAFRGGRQRQNVGLAAGRGDAVLEAAAVVFDVGGARQGVDADAVLAAVLADVFASGDAGLVVDRADIVQRAETIGGLDAAGVVDDERNAGVLDGLERRILGCRDPVGGDDGVGMLGDRLADQFGRIRSEVVVVLGREPGDRAALRLGDDAGVFRAALDDRPERIVWLAADDEDLGAVGHGGARAKRQRGRGDHDLHEIA